MHRILEIDALLVSTGKLRALEHALLLSAQKEMLRGQINSLTQVLSATATELTAAVIGDRIITARRFRVELRDAIREDCSTPKTMCGREEL